MKKNLDLISYHETNKFDQSDLKLNGHTEKANLAIVTGQIYIHNGEKCCEIVNTVTSNYADAFDNLSESEFIEQIETNISKEDEQYWFTAVVKATTEVVLIPLDILEYEDSFEIYEVENVQQTLELISKL